MKNPIIITSLEEDFKKIGLIRDAKPVQESVEEYDSDDSPDELAEKNTAKRKAVVTRDNKKVRTKKQTTKQKMAGKKRRRSAGFKSWAKKYARKMKRFAKKLAKRAAKAIRMGTRQESVEATTPDLSEALKSHANLAIIAEKLATYFSEVAQDCELEEMGESEVFGFMADYFMESAEQLAATAQGLHESAEFNSDALVESFNSYLEDVLDGVDLYEAMKEEEDEEEMDDEEESDEGEE